MPETKTIYARIPVPLKDAVDSYAERHGMTLANAVSRLLSLGLESASKDDRCMCTYPGISQTVRHCRDSGGLCGPTGCT